MKKTHMAAAFAGALFASIGMTGTANAQTGAELRGATANVELPGGVVNTVQLNADGTATIQSATGQVVSGNWFVQNSMLCLQAGGERECWPYQTPFQNGQAYVLTSDCSVTSRWTANGIQQPMIEQPVQQRSGERG